MQNREEWMLQGVREIYEFKKVGISDEPTSKIVLIGEGLDKTIVERSLRGYLRV